VELGQQVRNERMRERKTQLYNYRNGIAERLGGKWNVLSCGFLEILWRDFDVHLWKLCLNELCIFMA
jgi:hypothetical protein